MFGAATLIVLKGTALSEKLATDWAVSMVIGSTKSVIIIEPLKVIINVEMFGIVN